MILIIYIALGIALAPYILQILTWLFIGAVLIITGIFSVLGKVFKRSTKHSIVVEKETQKVPKKKDGIFDVEVNWYYVIAFVVIIFLSAISN